MNISPSLGLTEQQVSAFRDLLGFAIECERAYRKGGLVSAMMDARVKIDNARAVLGLEPMFKPKPFHTQREAERYARTNTYRYVFKEVTAGEPVFVVSNYGRDDDPVYRTW